MESILHKRYKVTERLFSNSLGELFLGRDIQTNVNQPLLIHYLPPQLLSDTALKQSVTSLQNLGKQAGTNVLKVLDCAWSEKDVFFVLQAPEAWSLTVLPALPAQPTKLHQRALETTQQLISQGLVTKGLDPSLFLVTPTGELHLLGTAFLSELQELQNHSPNLLQPPPKQPTAKKSRLLPLSLLAATSLVAAGSWGIYQFNHSNKPVIAAISPVITVSELDMPAKKAQANSALLSTEIELSPPPSAPEPKPQSPPAATVELTAAPTLVTPPPIEQTPAPTPNLSIEKLPSSHIPTTQTSVANPAATKHLDRAAEAIKNGHLQTGLYYLRLARKLNADQQQLQTTAQQLLTQAEKTDLSTQEAMSLAMQASIKTEFGLE
ncbi:MAG: hypothetical protein WBP46_18285 [Thiolinea sp.]